MVFFGRFFLIKTLIVSALAFILLTTMASASEMDVKQQELKNVQAQVEANRNQQSDIQKQEADLLKQIQDNDQQVAQLQTEIDSLQDELKKTSDKRQATEKNLSDLQKDLDNAQTKLTADKEKLAQRRMVFNKRLISTYKSSPSQIIAILVNSESLDDFITRTIFISQAAENDAKLVSEINHLVDNIKKKIAKINTEKRRVDEQRLNLLNEENRIASVENEVVGKQKQLQDELSKQQALLAQAQQEKIQLEQAEDMLVASEQMITNHIKQLQAQQSNTQGGGKLTYPVDAPITSPFGMRLHPILGVYRMHTGVDFGVVTGTPVHAAAAGTVIIAGPMGGYGNVVVIDHGGGLSTLYAHNSSLTVSIGEQVSQGQVISYSGSSGLATGPHLHFEVRVNGTPEDPMKWL